MEYTVEQKDGHTVVKLQGQFIFADNQRFKSILDIASSEAPPQRMVLDLSGVVFVDSAALGMLLLLKDATVEHGVSLTLSGAGGQVKKVFDVANFGSLFNVA